MWSGLATGDGFQATDLLPGKYLIEAFQRNDVTPSELHPFASARRTIDVGASGLDGIDLTLAPTLNLEGSLIFPPGCTPAPAWIMLRGDFAYDFHSGPDGRFAVRRLIPGKYSATIKWDGPSQASIASAKLGDVEIDSEGFEVPSDAAGTLNLTMNCGRR
jgi:hypothetical protein